MNTTQTGNAAEQAVASYLKESGYNIVERNWRTKFAEIDIVAQKQNSMYFVEVKYRKTLVAGDGFDYITPTKLHHMQRAAEAWVLAHDWEQAYELKAVSITGTEGNYTIDVRAID